MKAASRSFLARAAALAVAATLLIVAVALPAAASPAKKKKKKPRRPEPAAVPRPADPNAVTFVTSDGVTIVGTWRPIPGEPKAPAVLLIHDFSRDRREWEALSQDFLVHGLATLAIDLRGHGESTRKTGGGAVRLSPRLLRDQKGFPRDLKAALDWLHGRGASVGVIGLSTGANLAVLAAANGWVDAAVAVSPNLENLRNLAGPLPYHPRKTLLLASRLDPGREASAEELDREGSEPKKLILFPGAAHSMPLLAENLEARRAAVEWLASRLGAVSSATVGPGPGGGTFLSPMVGSGGLTPTPAPTPPPTLAPSTSPAAVSPTPGPR